MKTPSRWFIALTTLVVASAFAPIAPATAGTSQNPYLKAQQAKSDRFRPLEGKIERQEGSDLVDVSQFQGQANQSNTDRYRLPRNAGANTTQLQSGADDNQFQTGIGNNELRSGVARPGSRPPFPLNSKRVKLRGDVTDKELTRLSDYDVVVMQDRSSSMGEDERILGRNGEGFRKMSRWDWCLQEAADFTRQTSNLRNWFFTLVLFSSKYDVHHHVMLEQIPYIYNRSGIFIGTKLADPLQEQISMYFRRRAMGEKRPLLVAIITDGKPQDDENLRDLLIQTTYQMRDPNEVKIVFLQVGTSDDGTEKLVKLDQKLQRKGAKFDIVSVKPFYQLLQGGLTRTLVDTIQQGG